MNGLFQIWNKKITAIGALGSEQSKLCKSFTDFQWQKRNIGTPLGVSTNQAIPPRTCLKRSKEVQKPAPSPVLSRFFVCLAFGTSIDIQLL